MPNKQMKPVRDRVHSTRSPVSVRLPGDWKHSGAQIQLQHGAWAAAICAKFSPKKPTGTQLGTLIYLQLAKARLLLLRERQIFQRLLPASTISLSQTLLNTAIMPEQLPNQNSRSALALVTPRPFAGRSGASENNFPALLGPYRTGTGPSHGENRRLPLQFRTGAGHFTPVAQLLRENSLLRTPEPQAPLEQQRSLPHLVTRIVRQLQRVETNAMTQQSARELKHLTIPHDDAELMPSTRRRRHRAMEELNAAKEQAPAPPAINISQITENVLQQLDRRLVAARERMGRI